MRRSCIAKIMNKICLVMAFVLIISAFGCTSNQSPQNRKNLPVRAEDDAWPMFGRTPEGNRAAPAEFGPKTNDLELKWKWKSSFYKDSIKSMLPSDDFIYTSSNKSIQACNKKTLETIWEFKTNGYIKEKTIILDGNLYFVSDKMYCVNAKDGTLIWEYPLKVTELLDPPMIVGDNIYFGCQSKESEKFFSYIHCFDKSNGKLIWVLKNEFFSFFAIFDNRMYFSSDKTIFCVDLLNGKTIWKKEGSFTCNRMIVSEGRLFGLSGEQKPNDFRNNRFNRFSIDDGSLIWQTKLAYESISHCDTITDKIYFNSVNKSSYCISAADGKQLWSFKTGKEIKSSPVLYDGKVYFGSFDGKIYCLDATTGKKVWDFDSERAIDTSPVIYNNKLYFCTGYGDNSEDPILICLSLREGKEIWRHDFKIFVSMEPVFINDLLYLALYNEDVLCLNSNTGEKISTIFAGKSVTPFVVSNGRAYLSFSGHILYCINAGTGEKIWEFTAEAKILSVPTVSGTRVYFVSDDGRLFCLSATDGTKLWEFALKLSDYKNNEEMLGYSALVVGNRLFVGSKGGILYCIDARYGEKLWEEDLESSISSTPSYSNGKILVLANDFELFCLKADTGAKVWKTEMGNDPLYSYSPIISKGKIFFGYGSGYIKCYDFETGKLIWQSSDSPFGRISYLIVDKYLFKTSSSLMRYNTETGDLLDNIEFEKEDFYIDSIVASGDRIYMSITTNQHSKVICYDTKTNKTVWDQATDNAITALLVSYGRLYAVSYDGYFYCFGDKSETQSVPEYMEFQKPNESEVLEKPEKKEFTIKWKSQIKLVENDEKKLFKCKFADGLIYYVDGAKLYCSEINPFKVVWSTDDNSIYSSFFDVNEGKICIYLLNDLSGGVNSVVCHDSKTGKLLWSIKNEEGIKWGYFPNCDPLILENKIFVIKIGYYYDYLEYLNATTGELINKVDLKLYNPVTQFDNYKLIISGSRDDSNDKISTVMINPKDGSIISDISSNSIPVFKGNKAIFYEDNEIKCIDWETGKPFWSQKINMGEDVKIKIIGDKIIFDPSNLYDEENLIACYNLNDGNKLWTMVARDAFFADSLNDNIFADCRAKLYCINLKNGDVVWEYKDNKENYYLIVTGIFKNNEDIIVVTGNGKVICFAENAPSSQDDIKR